MSDEAPTMIVPEGTRLGWSDTGYSLLGLLGQTVMVNTTPTDEPGNGGVAFIARLLRVVTVERRGAEWGIALVFAGGGRVSVPLAGFRGSLAAGSAEAGELVVVTDHDTVTLRVV